MPFTSLEIDEARDIAVRRFRQNWTGTPLSQVIMQDQDDSKVDGGGDPWVRLTVSETGGGQQTLGSPGTRKYRRQFSTFVQIYTPKNEGLKRAGALSVEARRIYEGRSFDGLDFNDARVFPTRVEEKWQLTLVQAEGEFDEIK